MGPGRGSAAGSMVSYLMGITELDPLEHGLIFERFLNPERVSMPDVDVDFDERRRGEAIRYVTEKYGDDRVAMIVTYGTIKAKQALKDSARLLGFPFAMGEKLTKAMPPAVMGKDIPLSGIFDPKHERYSEAAEFRQVHETDPEAQRVVELARGIEGLKRQWGVHAAGVIMSSDPLIDIIPIMKRPQDGAIITQFDYPTSEGLGLIKMDFLGLRNLTILDDALENIVMNGKDPVAIEDVALDDKATYDLLASGNTLGVFQLDGGAMRSLLRQMRPDNFEDVSAVIALYRPGPMGMNSHINYALRKNGQQQIEAIHPEVVEPFAEILDETYGLIVYQEQVQRAAQIMAGYSLGQADLLRRAMGKKKPEVLAKEYVNFEAGAKEKGYSAAAIKAVWDTLVPFAGYAFNKAHSAGYGLVAYWTAYLKANYPAEYMAGLLQSVGDNKDKMALYLNECRRMGITVLPPDVNDSSAKFTAVKGDIRFGLTGVRNVGRNVVDAIVEAREEKGAFTSFQDFLDKVPAPVCNKRTIESLIKAGAFDSLGHTRRSLLVVHEQAVDSVIGVKRKEAEGQFDLFADFGGASDDEAGMGFSVEVPDLPDWEKKQKLQFEREMLGLYVSDHPLSGLEHVLQRAADTSIASLIADEGRPDNSVVTVAGLLTSVQRKMSKNGNPWAAVTVEDLEGAVEVMFFGETYLAYSTMLVEDQVVVLRGRVRRRDETHAAAGHGGGPARHHCGLRLAARRDRPAQPGGRGRAWCGCARCSPRTPGRRRCTWPSPSRARRPWCAPPTACGWRSRRPCSATSRRCSDRAACRDRGRSAVLPAARAGGRGRPLRRAATTSASRWCPPHTSSSAARVRCCSSCGRAPATATGTGRARPPATSRRASRSSTPPCARRHEELGVVVAPEDVRPLTVLHRGEPGGPAIEQRVDFMFEVTRWTGTPSIQEPDKAADLAWFPFVALPEPLVPHEAVVLRAVHDAGRHGTEMPRLLTFGF